MFKIAIAGKANSGKDSIAHLISEEFSKISGDVLTKKHLAFADPIKQIIKLMFPQVPDEWLYGKSSLRSNFIPGAFNNGDPLTVRQCLIDIGQFYKKYNPNIWVDNINHRLLQEIQYGTDLVVISDLRFKSEFNFLKKSGFKTIKLFRNESLNINHPSETEQDEINISDFDFVIHNNGSLDDLREKARDVAISLVK